MKLYLITTVWALLICLPSKDAKDAKKDEILKVSLLYEALGKTSKEFITKQVAPAYEKIGKSLLIDFVPYGRASHSYYLDAWKFTCKNGPNECWANKAQACGIVEDVGQGKTVDFIVCCMTAKDGSRYQTVIDCSKKLGVNYIPILNCAVSQPGDELLAKYGDQTYDVMPELNFVPIIIFNNIYNAKKQHEASIDFLKAACNEFEKKPDVCKKTYIKQLKSFGTCNEG